eukprot:COSAG03_NODE_605_length_6748_cov_9.478869_6_plen_90_part_00
MDPVGADSESGMLASRLLVAATLAVPSLCVSPPRRVSDRAAERKVMLWWALPGLGASEPPEGHNQTEIDQTLTMLKTHRARCCPCPAAT